MRSHRNHSVGLPVVALCAILASGASAERKQAERPFLWMNAEEIAAAKKNWEKPWAKEAFERSLYVKDSMMTSGVFHDMFRYLVLGDEEAGKREKASLLKFIGQDVTRTKPRTDRMNHAIQYDVFYDELTEEQRKGVEDTFRKWIDWLLFMYWRGPTFENANYPRGSKYWPEFDPKKPRDIDPKKEGLQDRVPYTRTNWLPNMLYPRTQGIMMMALALQDEQRIRELYETDVAGFRWYMDKYVADGMWYMEEFGKQYSTFGELLLWCRGCKRLGLDEYGFGHTNEYGPAMRRYAVGRYLLGFPAVPKAEGLPDYPMVTMGDTGMLQFLVTGSTEAGDNRHRRWCGAHMNGPIPRMWEPMYFELCHQEWPDAGFDYFLAQMRDKDEALHYPSLFFGLDPIDSRKVKPPPAPSIIAPVRGFALLRTEESPAYWTSPKPAVSFQFATYYVHYVHDCLSILQYYAFNSPILGWRLVGRGRGYAGGDPWQDSVRARTGIVVDSRQAFPVVRDDKGIEDQQIRSDVEGPVKFVAVRCPIKDPNMGLEESTKGSNGVYPLVDVERALFLTDEYLVEISNLYGKDEHIYDWNCHPIGAPLDKDGWEPSTDLNGGQLFEKMWMKDGKPNKRVTSGKYDLPNVHKRDMGGDAWSMTLTGTNGVQLAMHVLGGAPTTVYRDVGDGVTTTIARRKCKATTFVTVYEPFKDKPRITEVETLALTNEGIAIAVRGKDIDDWVLLAFGAHADKKITLAGEKERFALRGHAYLRRTGGVEALGDLEME